MPPLPAMKTRCCNGLLKPCLSPVRPLRLGAVAVTALSTALTVASAADLAAPPTVYESSLWSVRLGARPLFGVKASVSQSESSIQNGVYDNGFVLPDQEGGNETSYWAYQTDDQIMDGQLALTRLTGQPMAGLFDDEGNDPSLGAEIVGAVELVRFWVGQRQARFGAEVGFAYNLFSVENSSTASSTATRTTGRYNLGDTLPPRAPYEGDPDGNGPKIGLSPASITDEQSAAQASFDGELESHLYTLKLGFWLEYPLARRALLQASLGYASIYGDARLQYTEAVSYDDPTFPDQVPNRQTIGGRDWRAGGYAQLRFQYNFSRRVSAYLGGEIEYNESLRFSGNGRDITLDFAPLVAVVGGIAVRF